VEAALEATSEGGANLNVPNPGPITPCPDATSPEVSTSVEVTATAEVPAIPEEPRVPVVSVAVSPVYSMAGSRHRSHDSNDSGIELMRDGQYSRAVTAFEEEIRQTGSTNARYNLACAYALKGDKKLASDAFE